MRNFLNFVTLFVLFSFLSSLAIKAQEITKLRIDPSQVYGGDVSEYFDKIEYIPLETTKESLFGNIMQLIVTDSSYVVSDYDTKSILFFDLKGKYISKIKMKNDSEMSYMILDEKAKAISMIYYNVVQSAFKIESYTINGAFIKSFSTGVENAYETAPISFGDGYLAKKNVLYIRENEKIKDTIINLFHIYKGNQLYKKLIPINQKENPILSLANSSTIKALVNTDNSFYFNLNIENIIYKITKDTAIKLYKIVFPAINQMSKKFLELADSKKIDSALKTNGCCNENTIMGLENIRINNNRLFFTTQKMFYSSFVSNSSEDYILPSYNFIYNLQTGKLVSLEKMNPDSSNFYLPFLDGNSMNSKELVNTKGYVFPYLSSLKMFAAKEATQSKKPQYPLVLQQYFKTQSRKSNPVIVKMKIKE